MASGWPGALPRPGNRQLARLESVSPWFEVYRVAPGTYALLEPNHYEEVISYLILGTGRAILFDTGMGIGNIRAEVERLTGLPLIVVNSHSHYDHIGDNHRFAEVWAYDDEGEVGYVARGLSRAECARFLPAGSYRDLPPGFDPAAYEIRPSRVTRRLHHLETIDLGGRVLSVYHTPGHSPGSLCLLDGRQGLLFSGDTVYSGLLYAHFEASDFAAYRRSLAFLVGLGTQVSRLCPAHNEASVSPEMLAQVATALARIAAGTVQPECQDGIHVYRFDGFGVVLPDPDLSMRQSSAPSVSP